MEYTYNQPEEKSLPDIGNVKDFDWGLFGVNWLKSNPAEITVQVSIGINGADNVRDFVIPTPVSWDEESINTELLKLDQFKNSTKL